MSRKTRNLMWSVPLVAVFAVVGTLAIFAAVMPDGVLAHGLPGVVGNLEADADGHHAIDLSWDAPSGDGVDSYRIDRSEDGNTWVTHVPAHTSTSYTDMGLKAGTAYYYRVFAVNSSGTSPVSRDVTASTNIAMAPGAVQGLSSSADDQNNITVSWRAPASDGGSPIKSYEIHWNIDAEVLPMADVRAADNANVIATGGPVTSYAHEELTAGTRYRYQVYAVNDIGKATESGDTVAAVTGALVRPGSVSGVTAVQTDTARLFNLYWYAPTNDGGMDVSTYQVKVSFNGSRFMDVPDTVGLSVTTLTPGNAQAIALAPTEQATYAVPLTWDHDGDGSDGQDVSAEVAVNSVRFQVFAVTRADEQSTTTVDESLISASGATSRVSTILTDAADADKTLTDRDNLVPAPPTNVAAARDPFKNVDVAWNAPTTDNDNTAPNSIGGYRIDVSDDGVAWRSLVSHTRKADPNYKYVDTEQKNRYYRVFAHHGQYLGPANTNPEPSILESDTVTQPGHVSGLTLTVMGSTQIDLSWTAPADNGEAPISRYVIQTSMHNGTQFAEWPASNSLPEADADDDNKKSESTSYSHTELKAGQTWRYRVLAVNKVGDDEKLTANSGSAEVRQATTHQESMPDAPEMLTAESAKSSSSENAEDRGVLLLWNAPDSPAGATIGGYRVQRMKDGGAWEMLQSNTMSAPHGLHRQ